MSIEKLHLTWQTFDKHVKETNKEKYLVIAWNIHEAGISSLSSILPAFYILFAICLSSYLNQTLSFKNFQSSIEASFSAVVCKIGAYPFFYFCHLSITE